MREVARRLRTGEGCEALAALYWAEIQASDTVCYPAWTESAVRSLVWDMAAVHHGMPEAWQPI